MLAVLWCCFTFVIYIVCLSFNSFRVWLGGWFGLGTGWSGMVCLSCLLSRWETIVMHPTLQLLIQSKLGGAGWVLCNFFPFPFVIQLTCLFLKRANITDVIGNFTLRTQSTPLMTLNVESRGNWMLSIVSLNKSSIDLVGYLSQLILMPSCWRSLTPLFLILQLS